MRLHRLFAVGLLLALPTLSLRAESAPASPVRLIPSEADLLVEVPNPRAAAETLTTLKLLDQLKALPQSKELLDSTLYRRFYQLVAYFERELGAKWPELLDQVAGEGVVLGVKLGPQPSPVLLVLQGRDEARVARAYALALQVIEGEIARQEGGVKAEKVPYEGAEVTRIGTEFYMARVGKTVLLSNVEVGIKKGLDLAAGREKKSLADNPQIAEAAKLLPDNCLARLWLNMETVRKAPGAADFYKTPRDPGLSVLFGSYVDVLGRTPYVAVGLAHDKGELLATVRMPRGSTGAGVEAPLHMPQEKGVVGSLPLLEPKGVLFSDSFYLDVSRIWNDREALFGKDAAKAMADFDKGGGRIPGLTLRISELLNQAGVHHRIVVASQPTVPYKTKPKQPVPAFAVVTQMREPDEFSRTIEGLLRAGALAAGGQVKLKYTSETYHDVKIAGWRFAEDAPLKADVSDIRFNFSPCFARVNDQFVVCSTVELCRELVDLLQAEAKGGDKGSPAVTRERFYAEGIAELLKASEDTLITQAVLDQAIPAEEARQQVAAFLKMVRGAGNLTIETQFMPEEFRFEVRLK